MKLRERTTATLLIAIFMISSFAVMVSAGAQKGWGKPDARASAIGQFTSMFPGAGAYPSTEGDRCLVSVHARRVASGWTGKGVFRDKDYELTATLTVDSASEYVGELWPGWYYNQVILHGEAEVYINDVYIGVLGFHLSITDVKTFSTFPNDHTSFEIPALLYYACEWGTDISVKTTVDVPLE